MEIFLTQFVTFLLLFARITSLIVLAPLFGHQTVPFQLKVGLGLFLSFVMLPMSQHTTVVADVQFLQLVILIFQEVTVGLVIGFVTGLIFAGVRYAGDLIGFDLGFSFANVFNTDENQNFPLIGEFLYLFMMLIFLAINGHHYVLQALQLSYTAAPVGHFVLSEPLQYKMIELVGFVFIIAVKIAAPVIVAGFMVNIVLGILSRMMPQLHIFSLSFPIKIGVGVVALMVTSPFLIYTFKKLLSSFENNIAELIYLM